MTTKIEDLSDEKIDIAIDVIINGPFEHTQETNCGGIVYILRNGKWSIAKNYASDLNAAFQAVEWLFANHHKEIRIDQSSAGWIVRFYDAKRGFKGTQWITSRSLPRAISLAFLRVFQP